MWPSESWTVKWTFEVDLAWEVNQQLKQMLTYAVLEILPLGRIPTVTDFYIKAGEAFPPVVSE